VLNFKRANKTEKLRRIYHFSQRRRAHFMLYVLHKKANSSRREDGEKAFAVVKNILGYC
jgi:hypothetical protein